MSKSYPFRADPADPTTLPLRRVVITGGGTGGHVYPALAIAGAIEDVAEVVYVGDPHRLEGRVAPTSGYRFEALATPMTPGHIFGLPIFAVRLARSVARARRLLRDLGADLVIGVGGFVSVPTMVAAHLLRIPTVIHEQNVRPGRANRLMTRLGATVMATFEATAQHIPADRFVLTGLPVRPEIGATDQDQARKLLGIPQHAQVCLVVGGSNGAAALNQAAYDLARHLARHPTMHLLHVAGRRYTDQARSEHAMAGLPAAQRWQIVPYTDDIATWFAAADVVVSRSGSSTVNELLCAGRAAILVPSPNVAEDHQTANARHVESLGAAVLIPETDAAAIARHALALMHNPNHRQQLATAARHACPGSAGRTAIRAVVNAQLARTA